MYRFHNLKLVRSQTPIFALTWTVMHQVDSDSPLLGMTPELMDKQDCELIVTMTGLDETYSQTIHARHSYMPREIHWGYRFVDMFSRNSEGRRVINYNYFHNIIPEGSRPFAEKQGRSQPVPLHSSDRRQQDSPAKKRLPKAR